MLFSLSNRLIRWFPPEHTVQMVVSGALWNRGHMIDSCFLVSDRVFVKQLFHLFCWLNVFCTFKYGLCTLSVAGHVCGGPPRAVQLKPIRLARGLQWGYKNPIRLAIFFVRKETDSKRQGCKHGPDKWRLTSWCVSVPYARLQDFWMPLAAGSSGWLLCDWSSPAKSSTIFEIKLKVGCKVGYMYVLLHASERILASGPFGCLSWKGCMQTGASLLAWPFCVFAGKVI